jgi:hypothetical protein
MCTGVEPLLLQGAGAGASAYGAYSSSQASKAAYNAQAQIAENNAQLAEWQAEDATARGSVAASDQGLKTNQLKGTQRARMAANGVDLGVGSAQQILTDTDYFGAIDRARIVDNAAREAWGYRSQGTNFDSNANLLRQRAAAESPFLSAGTSLLTSAGKVSSNWYQGTAAASRETRATFSGVDYQKRGDY